MSVRQWAVCFLAVTASLAVVPPLHAQETSVEFGTGGGRSSSIEGHVTRITRTPSRPAVPASRGSSAPVAEAERVEVDATDERIIYTYPDGSRSRLINDPNRDYCHGTGSYITCFGSYELAEPGGGGRGGRVPAPPPQPSVIAEQTIVDLPLPEPAPQIDPGYAIAGLRVFLETGNSTSHDFGSIDTVLGPLSVTATSTYTVDWGDGTTTGPHASAGGPYPDGDVTHLYQSATTVDVTVTQNWTASWSLAGQSGTVTGLVTSGVIDGFVVRQVQAARQR